MFKHIVMWKLKDFAEGNSKAENAMLIKTRLEGLKEKISEIKHIEVGINILKAEQAYDAVLYSIFDTLDDLNAYQKHPEHVKVSEFIGRVRNERAVADYEADEA